MTQEEWTAIQNRDASFDGQFWYGPKTTNTFCCPSCSSRLPKPEHIIIYYQVEDALAAGRIPCRRCRPDRVGWQGTKKELADAASRLIEEQYLKKFSLDKLAAQLYVNKSYLVRNYREMTGQTLLWYHNHVRCEHAKELLKRVELNMTEISYMTGYCSSSHFSRVFQQMTGKTPTAWRKEYLQQLQSSTPS